MKFNRRELAVVIGVMVLVWAGLMFALGKWQRSRPPRPSEPELIRYPGTEERPEQTSPSLGLRKYWFLLNEDYPSKSVYYFYEREYTRLGWKRAGGGRPEWYRRSEGDRFYDLFYALWLSPDGLFQLELQMNSELEPVEAGDDIVGERRLPGIKVYVTQRRVLAPGLMPRREDLARPRGEIEAPSQ